MRQIYFSSDLHLMVELRGNAQILDAQIQGKDVVFHVFEVSLSTQGGL